MAPGTQRLGLWPKLWVTLLSERTDRIISNHTEGVVTAQPFDLWTFPVCPPLLLKRKGRRHVGAWLLITPIVGIVTIPQAFRPGCAPVVSRRLRYPTPSRAFQNSLTKLAGLPKRAPTWAEVTPDVLLTTGTGFGTKAPGSAHLSPRWLRES